MVNFVGALGQNNPSIRQLPDGPVCADLLASRHRRAAASHRTAGTGVVENVQALKGILQEARESLINGLGGC